MEIARPTEHLQKAHDLINMLCQEEIEGVQMDLALSHEVFGMMAALCWSLGHKGDATDAMRRLLRRIHKKLRENGESVYDEHNVRIDIRQLWKHYPANMKGGEE